VNTRIFDEKKEEEKKGIRYLILCPPPMQSETKPYL
jgi:hypothetical protein